MSACPDRTHGRCLLIGLLMAACVDAQSPATDTGRGGQPGLMQRFGNLWTPGDLKTSDRPAAVERMRVPLWTIVEPAAGGPAATGARTWPVTFGVPLPMDQVWSVSQMRIVDGDGRDVPASIVPTATWSEGGSLQWVLVDLQTRLVPGRDERSLVLEYGTSVQPPPPPPGLAVMTGPDAIKVDTGPLRVAFSRTSGRLIDQAWCGGQAMLGDAPATLSFTDQAGAVYRSQVPDEVEVEFQTAMRVVVRSRGWYAREDGQQSCRYDLRACLYHGQPIVRVFTTWTITADTDRMQWQDLAVHVPLAGQAGAVSMGGEAGPALPHERFPAAQIPVVLAQTQARRWSVTGGGAAGPEGKKAGGWVDVATPRGGLMLYVHEMAGQFPNALEAGRGGVIFHAFSNLAGHNLGFRREDVRQRIGEQAWELFEKSRYTNPPLDSRYSNARGLAKTHELVLVFRPAATAGPDVASARVAARPPLVLPDPAWNCGTLAFGPFHPRDHHRFPAIEAAIDEKLEEWLHVTSHLEPHYGFYDHGRGVPHHIRKTTAADGEDAWIYDGYRRNYDLGYGNTFVPWLMYLRSGDRRWLDIGVNMARHEMDIRHVHPSDPPSRFPVGAKYWHYGSWSFDGSSCGFQDAWYWNLLLCYYTTGYPRALEVLGEIMESVRHEALVTGRYPPHMPGDRTSRTAMAGSVALYYKATWDPRYRALWEALVPTLIAGQNPDGRYNVRMQWINYGYFHGMFRMPEPPAAMVDAHRRFNLANLRIPERTFMWANGPHSLWWTWQETGNPQVSVLARQALNQHTRAADFTFIGYGNFDRMWKVPVYMHLVQIPEAERAVPIERKTIARPHESPVFVRHRRGRATHLEVHYQGELKVVDHVTGQAVGEPAFRLDPDVLIHELVMAADEPDRLLRVQAAIPQRQSDFLYGALTLPWEPDSYPMVLKWTGPSPLADAPEACKPQPWAFTDEDGEFPAGRFGRGVRVCGRRSVQVPLGDRTESPHRLAFYNASQGTLEFWVRFEHPVHEGAYGGDLVWVHGKPGPVLTMSFREAWYVFLHNHADRRIPAIYNARPVIEPGRWHHVAMQWNYNDGGKIMRRFYLDGYAGPSGATSDRRDYWPNTLTPGQVTGPLQLGGAEGEEFATIDELRISSVPRYPFGDRGERTFEPPAAPLEFDDQTLLICRFDDRHADVVGGGRVKLTLTGFQGQP